MGFFTTERTWLPTTPSSPSPPSSSPPTPTVFRNSNCRKFKIKKSHQRSLVASIEKKPSRPRDQTRPSDLRHTPKLQKLPIVILGLLRLDSALRWPRLDAGGRGGSHSTTNSLQLHTHPRLIKPSHPQLRPHVSSHIPPPKRRQADRTPKTPKLQKLPPYLIMQSIW